MVATRRSLGGQATPVPSSSPPAAASTELSRAQQAALKKLDIAGTDALKGDAKAAQAARDQVQTYHYRGAVYAADANTPSAWLENQPKRYLKRSRGDSAGAESRGEGSIVVGGEEEDDDDDDDEEEDEDDSPARPAKRRRSMPLSRGKPRAGRGGSRSSLPVKRKAEKVGGLPSNNSNNNISNNKHNTAVMSAIPTTKPRTLPDQKAMNEEIQRRKQEAMKKNYNVEQLDSKDIMTSARTQLVKLARKQMRLKALLLEWNQAKELLEAKQKEAGVKLLEQVEAEAEDAPVQTNYQPIIELGLSDDDNDDEEQLNGNGDELHEQWQREQEQNRKHQQAPEIPETSPAAQEMQASNISPAATQQLGFTGTQHFKQPSPTSKHPTTTQTPTPDQALPTTETHPEAATTAGASRPSTPTSATHANPQPAQTTTPSTSTTHSSTSKDPNPTTFSHLPPDSVLPTTASDGNPLRWTLKRRRRSSFETGPNGEGEVGDTPEFAIDLKKLQGESKSARLRRIRRERDVAGNWARWTGGRVVEEGGS